MGVSLERVQFKFASIIGELCSEPDVLSQFAVWLDLRLAEYKLKGAISLDCSGEEPDPIWLKGLNKIKTMKSENTSSFPPQTSSYHESSEIVPSMDASERLSPEVVFVKDEIEPLPDVFRRGGVDSQALRIRKRPSNETSTYSSDHFSSQSLSSPPKQRRLSPHEDSPSNQSLMSVLSGVKGDTQESDTRGDYSVLPGPSSTSSMAAINADSMGEAADQFNDGSFSNSQMALSDWDALQHPTDASQNNDYGPEARPHGCPMCAQTFTMRRNLKRHMKLHEPSALKQLFRCALCDGKYSRADNYKAHFVKKHPEAVHQSNAWREVLQQNQSLENVHEMNQLNSP